MKLEKIEKAESRGVSVVVNAAVLVLLVIIQLPLAADFFASRFTLESSYNLVEADEPENDKLDLVVPDFLHTPAGELQENARYGVEFNLVSASHEVHASFSNIRAPPDFS
jgi:hypothetical protein